MRSRLFLFVALVTDVLIAISKFVAAAITGSAAMISEGVHSVIDAVSQLMLIWGVKISRKGPDDHRPFGYGKELYFWSFMVSLVMFILGGCFSFYKGLQQIKKPMSAESSHVSYIVLGIAVVFNSISLYSALKEFNRERGETGFWEAIKRSKDPSTFIVLLGDIGDILGLIVAFVGIYLRHLLKNPYYDGIASMIIGFILILISGILLRESKSLLMGETTSKKTLRRIVSLTEADDSVLKVKKHFSMYMAPEEVLLQLNAVFRDNLTTQQITDAIERISQRIKREFPKMKQIFIEPVRK